MFDLKALQDAGFEKALSTEEWEQLQAQLAQQYSRPSQSNAQEQIPGGVVVDYVLKRGDVRVSTQQNTQDQAPYGISMTVRYPQIAMIENEADGRRVSCDAANTALILLLAEEIGKPLGHRPVADRGTAGLG